MAKAEGMRAHVDAYNTQILSPISDLERMQLYRDGLNKFESLDRNSQAAFHAQLTKIFLLGQTDFMLERQGLLEHSLSLSVQRLCVTIIKTPALAQWWERTKTAFVAEYVNHLDTIRKELDVPPITEIAPWYGPDQPAGKA